jgi:hypothetical protein
VTHRAVLALTAVVTTVVIVASGVGTAWGVFNKSSASSFAVTTATLAAPTGLSATPTSTVALSWTATVSANATGTRVFRSTTSGSGYTQIAQIAGLATTTYTDHPGTGTFYYVVEAYYSGNGANWTSANSTQASATVAQLHIDTSVTPADGNGAVTTVAFNTSAPDTLVAFVSSDGPNGAGQQSVTVSGAGLTWSLVKRTNSQPGDAEIWKATASTALTNVTVKSTPVSSGFDEALTVVAFANSTGVGASASGAAASGAPTVSLTTTGVVSWVYGVGHDYDHATARTLGSGQTLVSQWVDAGVGDTDWVQSTSALTNGSGTLVTLNDTAPTTDHWNLAAVEVISS